jgi:hypothetical protein
MPKVQAQLGSFSGAQVKQAVRPATSRVAGSRAARTSRRTAVQTQAKVR